MYFIGKLLHGMGRLVISRYTSSRQRGSLEHIYIETTTKYIDLVPNIYEALAFLHELLYSRQIRNIKNVSRSFCVQNRKEKLFPIIRAPLFPTSAAI